MEPNPFSIEAGYGPSLACRNGTGITGYFLRLLCPLGSSMAGACPRTGLSRERSIPIEPGRGVPSSARRPDTMFQRKRISIFLRPEGPFLMNRKKICFGGSLKAARPLRIRPARMITLQKEPNLPATGGRNLLKLRSLQDRQRNMKRQARHMGQRHRRRPAEGGPD